MGAVSAAVTAPRTSRQARSYGSGARILSIGIATTGVLTFAYFSIASHVLGEVAAKRIDLLWSIMFVIISVIYRPIEQLLSRTIADRRARGHAQHSVRVPIAIQGGFALTFLIVALALKEELVNHVFDHYSALYDVLVVGTLAYAASYFARGWLAGHEYFGLFGGLVLMEALSRLCFVLAVALGITSGQTAVALGIAAAPFVSLVVVPAAFARHSGEHHGAAEIEELDAALAGVGGPGSGGVEEAVAADELSRLRLRVRGLGRDALRADAAERGGSDGGHNVGERRARGDRVQRAADRARAATALPSDPDVVAPPPDGSRGNRGTRGVRARDPPDGTRDRRVRGRGCARVARGGAARHESAVRTVL
jgi:hypothetical protein